MIVALSLLYWYKHYVLLPRPDFPPGPWGLPLIGHLPILKAENIFVGLDAVHDKYGDVMGAHLGPGQRAVFIGDYAALKQAFKDDKPAARPPSMMWFNKEFRYGDGTDARGLLFSHGKEWSEQRRFTLRRLRDFGLGKSTMEGLILEEISQFFTLMDKELHKPISVKHMFNISVVNSLWTLIAGKRMELTDPYLVELVKRVDALGDDSFATSILHLAPSIRFVAPQLSGWTKAKGIVEDVIEFVSAVIKEHVENFENNEDLKEHPNDYIDAFLGHIATSEPDSSFHGELGYQNLRSSVLDLLLAGTETTSTTLAWSVLFMIRYPEIQSKVRQEIYRVVGNDRLPTLDDRANLPYLEAVMQEVFRCSCIAGLAIPHYAQEDIHVSNYMIPKGTTVFPNLYRIMNNPKVFPNPHQFDPDRFLDDQGNYVKNEQNVAFSIGKRDCLGKSLAINQFYLFFAALIQRYTFATVLDDVELINMKPDVGVAQKPMPFKVTVSKN